MKRIVRAGVPSLGAALVLLAAPADAGGPLEIEFRDSVFDPANPPAQFVSPLGEEVVWVGPEAKLDHNVLQDSRLFTSGAPGATAEYHEDISAGRYHYYCRVHGSQAGGMDGVVRIKPAVLAGNGKSARVIWADSAAEARHRFEVQFRRPNADRWRTWRRTTKRTFGEFGAGDQPIDANPDATYGVRVRTFVKRNRDRRSGWARVGLSVSP